MNELGPQRRQTKKCGTNVKDENDYLFHFVWGIFWFLDVGKSIIRNQCIIMEYIEGTHNYLKGYLEALKQVVNEILQLVISWM